MIRRFLAALCFLAAVPAFAPALAQDAPVDPVHQWPFAASDLAPDPAFRFGRLANGMRYIVRANATPKGTAMVRLWVDDGSLAESDGERGYAHFLEHMAFKGSTRVPEGEVVRLLERKGLAFGADTNAATGYDVTLYRLDLPRADADLVDTALMLMRETASELTLDPAAIEREKGVILSEMRVRDTYQVHDYLESVHFADPGARFVERLPIGDAASVRGATAAGLRAFYRRAYRPENCAVIVVGDVDPAAVEAAIRARFGDWQPAPLPPRADPGPIPLGRHGQTDIYLDPSLAEHTVVSRAAPWRVHEDTAAWRAGNLRREIAYAIVNRRLARVARGEGAPFRSAALGTVDLFHTARTTQLAVESGDGEWARALVAVETEYRRVLRFEFTQREVDEQVADLRTALENAAAGADTRPTASFVTAAIALLQERQVPTTPQSALDRFRQQQPQVTPATVLAALRDDLVPLDDPLIRFEGRHAPAGGAAALRQAWEAGGQTRLAAPDEHAAVTWGYGDFGPPGAVVSDTVEPRLGIRQVVFANGLKVDLKPTELQHGAVLVHLDIDGGGMLNTRASPLATGMTALLPAGGLGKHSLDELQSVFAGHAVAFAMASGPDTFALNAATTPHDLALQLQLLAAAVTDPGYRPQGEVQYRRAIRNLFSRLDTTPADALSNALGRIESDGDPRFTLQPMDAYLALSFAQLRAAISDRLAHGAMELALVGDFDPATALDAIARTLGALPAREPAFRSYADNRQRSFTANRTPRTVVHSGPADQAIVRFTWPTRDDSDEGETVKLTLLEQVMRLSLTDTLREQLGQVYTPGVNAAESEIYPGYGTFTIAAPVDAARIDAARQAMLAAVRAMIAQGPSADMVLRARAPMLQAYDNALKSNGGLMNLVGRAQRKPDRIARFERLRPLLEAITPAELQATAARYLAPDQALEIDVVPRAAAKP